MHMRGQERPQILWKGLDAAGYVGSIPGWRTVRRRRHRGAGPGQPAPSRACARRSDRGKKSWRHAGFEIVQTLAELHLLQEWQRGQDRQRLAELSLLVRGAGKWPLGFVYVLLCGGIMQSNVNIAWRGMDGAGFQYGYYREGERQTGWIFRFPARAQHPTMGRTRSMSKARRSERRIHFRGLWRWRASFFRFKDKLSRA